MSSASSRTVVRADDGAVIAVDIAGSGPGLVVVSGALVPPGAYDKLIALLAPKFTVHHYHRRGRGSSAPQATPYSMDQEVADLEAVLAATGTSQVLGHSYGGLITLCAALRPDTLIGRLVVFDPALSIDHGQPTAYQERFERALAQGHDARAFTILQRELDPAGLLARAPEWLHRFVSACLLATVAATWREPLHTVLPEAREATGHLDSSAQRYAAIEIPSLVMIGGDSVPWLKKAGRAVAEALGNAEFHELPGLNHNAPLVKPAAVAATVRKFLASSHRS